jgi:hypothetical protein
VASERSSLGLEDFVQKKKNKSGDIVPSGGTQDLGL